MLRSLFFIFFILLSLSACPAEKQQSTTSSQQNLSSSAKAPVSSKPIQTSRKPPPRDTLKNSVKSIPKPVPEAVGLHKGIFVYGAGYQTFKACGNDQEIWVVDTAKKTLGSQYESLHLMELAPSYVELMGRIRPARSTDGFAADYKLALHVSEVKVVQPFGPGQPCFQTEFMAMGNGPEWSLQVLKGSDVFFQAQEGEFPYVDTLAYSPPKQEGNSWRYHFRFRTPDPEILEARFTEESCQYGNQDYAFRAEISFRGSNYKGCARKP